MVPEINSLLDQDMCLEHYKKCRRNLAMYFFAMRNPIISGSITRRDLHNREMFLLWVNAEPAIEGPCLDASESAILNLLHRERMAPDASDQREYSARHWEYIHETLQAIQRIRDYQPKHDTQ